MAAVAIFGVPDAGRRGALSWQPSASLPTAGQRWRGAEAVLQEKSPSQAPASVPLPPGPTHLQSPNPLTSLPVETQRSHVLAEQLALAELVRRCRCGEGSAWEELARSQHRRVYALCYRFTGSVSESEDLTQEVFLKVFRNLEHFDPARGAFTTWLTSLTRNLLVDHYRRSRMERVTDSLDVAGDGQEDGPTRAERLPGKERGQHDHVAGLQLRAQVQAALTQVSPELREAVILRDLEDMDYREIAEVLGVPQGTVKSRISRGRAELARLLKRLEGQVI